MSTPGPLTQVTDANLQDVVDAQRGVLVLAKTDCGYCAGYEREILDLMDQGVLPEVVVGKMYLDKPGSGRFKKGNPWLLGLDVLPFTLLFSRGQQMDAFAASRASYLRERIEDNLPGHDSPSG